MHLSRISVENVRAVERLVLDLSTPSGPPRRRAILLGANGSGKTTTLTAIAHVLARVSGMEGGDQAAHLDAGDVRASSPHDDQTERDVTGTIELDMYALPDERQLAAPDRGMEIPVELPFREQLGARSSTLDPTRLARGAIAADGETIKRLRFASLANAIMNRSSRPPCVLLPADRGTLADSEQLSVSELSDYRPRRGALSTDRSRFGLVPSLLALAFAAPARNDPDGVIDRMWKVLAKYFPELPRPVGIHGLRLVFEADGTVVTLPQLSDGQRAVLLILGELALRNPANGVVLIDEIEQHLHPRWQRAMLDALLAMLPTTQFILTTQAPYVAVSAPDDVVTIGDWERDGVA